jgi:hypothetical protein
MIKFLLGLVILFLVSSFTIYFQRQTALRGEKIAIIRSSKYNHGRLPDIIHDYFPNYKRYQNIPDIFVKVYLVLFILLLVFHNKIDTIGYHTMILLSIIFFIRTLFFTMTILPSIQKNCHVEKKKIYNKDLGSLIADIFINRTGDLGYCNDYIFSGHSSLFILITLLITYFNLLPPILLTIVWLTTMLLTVLIVIGRNHYTIDIVLAYFFTYFIFNCYKQYI